MRYTRRRHAQSAIGMFMAFTLQACAATTPALQTGPNAEITFDGLTRVDNARLQAVWLREDLDLSTYRGLILENAGIEFRPVRSGGGTDNTFPLSETDKRRFVQIVTEQFRSVLAQSERFEIVTEPGPDVLLLRGTLLDVVSNVPPRDSGRTQIYLRQVAEATLVVELYDSQSGAILARAVERRAAEDRSGRAMSAGNAEGWEQVRALAALWARTLRRGLDELATTGAPRS